MTIRDSATLEGYFNTGDTPSEANFHDLIESLLPLHPGGRLTLTSGTPVTTSNVTAATTLYYAPYKHNLVRLYDGTEWKLHNFTERSIAVPATIDTNYDVFLYDNAGTLTLELTAWTNATTRATALTRQDGVLVKTGATTRLYLGTIRTTGVSGQVEDSVTKRLVWNYYNRVRRHMAVADATSHGYGTATYRAWNNDASLRLEFVAGVGEDAVIVDIAGNIHTNAVVSPGLDSTSVVGNIAIHTVYNVNTSHIGAGATGWIVGNNAEGYHYVQALEIGYAAGATFGSVRITALIEG